MKKYKDYTRDELASELGKLKKEYGDVAARGLRLDMSRGKPNGEQLDTVNAILTTPLTPEDYITAGGADLRNYGGFDGIPEMKKLFSELYSVPENYIFVGGNSSLQLMYDALCRAMLFGTADSPRPWSEEKNRKWICIAPGYDRHFAITEMLGFTLLTVSCDGEGIDIDRIEELARDPDVKGIWCVPKYSNPTGCTYSADTVRRLVSMECGAPDFRIYWDNAYGIHDFSEDGDALADIFAVAEECGNPDRIFYFASTSKITNPGAGVAMFAATEHNLAHELRAVRAQTIGYDKLNQLRHVKYLKNPENVKKIMAELAAYMRPRFSAVYRALTPLRPLGIAGWSEPRGGYFISLDVLPGTAHRVWELMRGAGVTLTPAGATYPYGRDPEDRNLRIAPSYPTEEEIAAASDILALCVRIAALEHYIGE